MNPAVKVHTSIKLTTTHGNLQDHIPEEPRFVFVLPVNLVRLDKTDFF